MDEEKYRQAKARVRRLKGFYIHLLTYIVVNVMLAIIDLITSPNSLWFYWITLFWGFAVVFDAMSVFGEHGLLGRKWEEKKIKEMMDEEEAE
ncbi:MAG: 2TM domain-containing protein [Methermicoccaceae archaeon]